MLARGAAIYPQAESPFTAGVPVERDMTKGTMGETTDLLLRRILGEVLALKPGQAEGFADDTGLFGHLPELDSMAVAGLLTEIEDRFHIVIEDEDVDGDMLATYGALHDFVEARRQHG